MKKRFISALLAAVMGACFLTGCQQAPEISENGEITHAKSNVEQDVEDVVAQGAENRTDESTSDTLAEQGGFYDDIIGTEENGIWIYADVPAVTENISRLTLAARDDLDADTLCAFLDSPNGKAQDVTQQYLAEQEEMLNAQPVEVDAGDGIEESYTEIMTHFGDESTLAFSDGERKATFTWNTSAYFQDEKLLEKYYEIAASAQLTKELGRGEGNEDVAFTMAQAEELLMKKLGTLGITEIDYMEIYYYEHDKEGGYELHFTPRYEGIGLAQEFGMTGKTEVIPCAMALLTKDGVAEVNLWHCLGKIEEKKAVGKILDFFQVENILAKYLESNMIAGCAEAKLTQAEVVYYPIYQEEAELELIPAWHIYVPLEQVIEGLETEEPAYGKLVAESAVWNIYIDAVTGELLRAE